MATSSATYQREADSISVIVQSPTSQDKNVRTEDNSVCRISSTTKKISTIAGVFTITVIILVILIVVYKK